MNKNNGFASLIAVVIGIIIVAIGVGGYFVIAQKLNVSAPQPPQQIQNRATTTAASTPVGWKHYQDAKYGFSFDYPADFTINTKTSVPSPTIGNLAESIRVMPPYWSYQDISVSVQVKKILKKDASLFNNTEAHFGKDEVIALEINFGDAGFSSQSFSVALSPGTSLVFSISTDGNRPNAKDIPSKVITGIENSFAGVQNYTVDF